MKFQQKYFFIHNKTWFKFLMSKNDSGIVANRLATLNVDGSSSKKNSWILMSGKFSFQMLWEDEKI